MSVKMSSVVQEFNQSTLDKSLNQMLAREEKLRDHQNYSWLGNGMDARQFVRQLSRHFTCKVKQMVALEEKSGELQRLQDLSSGDHECLMALYDVIFCLDQNSHLTDKLKSTGPKTLLPVGLKGRNGKVVDCWVSSPGRQQPTLQVRILAYRPEASVFDDLGKRLNNQRSFSSFS